MTLMQSLFTQTQVFSMSSLAAAVAAGLSMLVAAAREVIVRPFLVKVRVAAHLRNLR
jgi:hypothetical protein